MRSSEPLFLHCQEQAPPDGGVAARTAKVAFDIKLEFILPMNFDSVRIFYMLFVIKLSFGESPVVDKTSAEYAKIIKLK